MDYQKTKEYLAIVVDMEKNLYVLTQTIKKLESEKKSLGREWHIAKPQEATTATFDDSYLKGGVILGTIAGAVITFIQLIPIISDRHMDFGAFFSTWMFWLVYIGAGALLGIIVGGLKKSNQQSKYDNEYQERVKKYDDKIVKDKQRIKKELSQVSYYESQISALRKMHRKVYDNLRKLYLCNIIHKEYWFDFVAVCSFYQYFDKKQTYSLEFDRTTGDPGAYRLYEIDRRMDYFKTKLDEISVKLDEVIENQYMLASQMNDANRRIEGLRTSVAKESKRIQNSVNQQTAVALYDAECNRQIEAELRFMNNMNLIYNWN